MQIVENEVLTGKTVVLDDKTFVNGVYTNCPLLYSGGEFNSVNTKFVNCPVTLTGAAQRTANLLNSMGLLPKPAPMGGVVPKKPDGVQ